VCLTGSHTVYIAEFFFFIVSSTTRTTWQNTAPQKMSTDRSAERNVHIYHPDDLVKPLGGLVVTNGITYANFYAMVEVFLFFSSPFVLRHEDVTDTLRDTPKDEQPLQPGNYYVIAEGEKLPCVHWQAFVKLQAGSIKVNDEHLLVRTISLATGTRVVSFRDDVRERDRRCVVIARQGIRAQYGFWIDFQSARLRRSLEG
jgi:hypothetical protein